MVVCTPEGMGEPADDLARGLSDAEQAAKRRSRIRLVTSREQRLSREVAEEFAEAARLGGHEHGYEPGLRVYVHESEAD